MMREEQWVAHWIEAWRTPRNDNREEHVSETAEEAFASNNINHRPYAAAVDD
jgi:hypothetical protein